MSDCTAENDAPESPPEVLVENRINNLRIKGLFIIRLSVSYIKWKIQ